MDIQAINLLKKFTGHSHVELTSRGNTAIFAGLYVARKLRLRKKTVLIPDQGGWLSYKKYPKMLEMKIIELRTDLGLINFKALREAIDENDVNSLIYQNPAGYYAEQDIREIFGICKGRCTVILDVSGSIGDKDLCNGEYADIMVGSFGKAKPVNVGYGGFVSIRDDRCYEKAREIFNTTSFDEEYLAPLVRELKGVRDKLTYYYNISDQIKKDLKGYDIANRHKKGINVIVMYEAEKEKQEIIEYCEKNKYEYTQCPRYIRIMKDAISIEVKRLRYKEI